MTAISKDSVSFLVVDEAGEGQRIDNYLFLHLKGVPKSHIYRIIRSGEIRVNKKRAKATVRLCVGDEVRIPPIRIATENAEKFHIPAREFPIVYEDDALLIINKPSGVAVHGGSGITSGVIEQIRKARLDARYLELVHRLDKETSGILMLAKRRSPLVKLHEYLRQGTPHKVYYALANGIWNKEDKHVKLPLVKFQNADGERFVRVDEDNGVYAHTIFEPVEYFDDFTLLKVTLRTGRTHQIRVHMQALGHPIAGDEKYGDFELNKKLVKLGLKRMFLHASQLNLLHPVTGKTVNFEAPLPEDLTHFLDVLRTSK